MELSMFAEILQKLSSVSIYSVLLLIIIVLGWALWKAVNKLTSGKEASEALTKQIAQAFELHNLELSRNNEMMERNNVTMERNNSVMEQVLKFTESQAEWLRALLGERLSQDHALSRLEQYSRDIVENIAEVKDAVRELARKERARD